MHPQFLNLEQELLQDARKDGIEKIVVGSIAVLDGKVLLLKRAPSDDYLPGFTEIPGGGVENGESILRAVAREHHEETGCEPISVDTYVGFFDYVSGSGKKTRQFNFSVTVKGMDVQCNPSEHSEYFWLGVEDEELLHSLRMSREMKQVIQGVLEQIKNEGGT